MDFATVVRLIALLSILLPIAVPLMLVNSLVLGIGDLLGVQAALSKSWMRIMYGWKGRRWWKRGGYNQGLPLRPFGARRQVSQIGRKNREKPSELEPATASRIDALLAAYASNGFSTDPDRRQVIVRRNRIGICIDHSTARDEACNRPKRSYYVEGSHFEMGLLLGELAAADIPKMSNDYVKNVVFAFIGLQGNFAVLGGILADLVYRLSRWTDAIVPDELSAEIFGLWQGARLAGQHRNVSLRDLFVLNYGVDVVLSYMYSGFGPLMRIVGLDPKTWRLPVACNGFAAWGEAAGGGAYFGRDFMFPTCNVFGSAASHILYRGNGFTSPREAARVERIGANASLPQKKPDPTRRRTGALSALRNSYVAAPGKGKRPAEFTVVMAAPGMVGAVSALNERGVAMGVDMVNGRNCSPRRIGLNSLMMVRYATQYSASAVGLVRLVQRLPRGLTWLYLVADGPRRRAAVIEAGASRVKPKFLSYVPKNLKQQGMLPDEEWIRNHRTATWRNGIMVRWDRWVQDPAWFEFNPRLFSANQKPFKPEDWGERGYLVRNPHDTGVPDAWYFAPQREHRKDVMVVSNHYIIPEMRLLAMNRWTALIASVQHNYDDFQWRYDELNATVLSALESGPLDFEKTRSIINFLRPYETDGRQAKNFFYYGKPDGVPLPADRIRVGGSVCAFDLIERRVESLYGFYSEEWVCIRLPLFEAAVANTR